MLFRKNILVYIGYRRYFLTLVWHSLPFETFNKYFKYILFATIMAFGLNSNSSDSKLNDRNILNKYKYIYDSMLSAIRHRRTYLLYCFIIPRKCLWRIFSISIRFLSKRSFSFKTKHISEIWMHLQFTIIVNDFRDICRYSKYNNKNITDRYKNWMQEMINAQHLKLKFQNYLKWYANQYFSRWRSNYRKTFWFQIERWAKHRFKLYMLKRFIIEIYPLHFYFLSFSVSLISWKYFQNSIRHKAQGGPRKRFFSSR